MIAVLAPIRERAVKLQADPARVHATLRRGAVKARALARETMAEVRSRMGLLEGATD